MQAVLSKLRDWLKGPSTPAPEIETVANNDNLSQAWVWLHYQASLGDDDAVNEILIPFAWVWSQYYNYQNRLVAANNLADHTPTPLAWVWSAYRAQMSGSSEQPNDTHPLPFAWVWSAYKAEFPQSDEEALLLNKLSPPYDARPHHANTQTNAMTDHTHAKLKSCFMKNRFLSLSLLFNLLLITSLMILSKNAIKLKEYQLASSANICGPTVDPQSPAIAYIQRLTDRENCLNASRDDRGPYENIYKILKDLILNP